MTDNAWSTAMTAYRTHLISAKRAQNTITFYVGFLRSFAKVCPRPWSATTPVMERWLAAAARKGRTAGTQHGMHAALRSFYSWAYRNEYIPHDPSARLTAIRVPKRASTPATRQQVMRALETAPSLRVVLMVRLGAESGLRRSEIAGIHADDLDEAECLLRVIGKGSKERFVPVTPDLMALLVDQAQEHLPVGGWVFPNGRGGHLSGKTVGELLSAEFPDGVTAHKLRHYTATTLMDEGAAITEVSELLGHASVAQTQRYVRVNRTRLTAMQRQAAALLHEPLQQPASAVASIPQQQLTPQAGQRQPTMMNTPAEILAELTRLQELLTASLTGQTAGTAETAEAG